MCGVGEMRVLVFFFLLALASALLRGNHLPIASYDDITNESIDKSHPFIPQPYHTTDAVLAQVESLASTCKQPARFSLQHRRPGDINSRDVLARPLHGKADDFFDSFSLLEVSSTTSVPRRGSGSKLVDHIHDLTKEIPVLKITLPSQSTKQSALVMFGEHGRELISAEVGLSFLSLLHSAVCTDEIEDDNETVEDVSLLQVVSRDGRRTLPSVPQVRALLQHWDLTVLPLVSPSARYIAEKCDYCNRVNLHGIDINRNYPFHFGTEERTSQEKPGASAMSEMETQVAVAVAKELKPKLFITVHSGSELIVTSPAYRKIDFEHMPKSVREVMTSVQQEYCPSCKAGPASQVLPYLATGCSMDFMFEESFRTEAVPAHPVHDHFAFTFEIWQGEQEKENVANINLEEEFGDEAKEVERLDGEFQTVVNKLSHAEANCLKRFNPPPSFYRQTVTRWVGAVLAMMEAVSSKAEPGDA